MKKTILALPTKNIVKIKKFFTDEIAISWLYIGEDFTTLYAIEEKLGKNFRRIDISHLLNEVSNDIKYDFIRWMDDINARNCHNLDWWLGTISGRDNDSSYIFKHICYIKVIEMLYQRDTTLPDLIFVESVCLAKTIIEWGFEKGFSIKFIHSFMAYYKVFFIYGRCFLQWCKFVFITCIRVIAAYISRNKQYINEIITHPIAIIDTFIYSNDISNDGIFTDRYYPHLYEFITKKGISILVHPVLYGMGYRYISIYNKMRNSNIKFIIREDFLHLTDYLATLLYPIRVLLTQIKHGRLIDVNISAIINEDKFRALTLTMEAILIYRLFIRLGKTKFKPDLLINWHENQVIDKALIAGMRKSFPNVPIIGIQMFLHSPNTLRLCPIQSEVDYNFTPDTIVGIGEFNHTKALTFAKNLKCKTGAALRYAHIFNHKEESKNISDKKIILIILSYHIAESVELINKLSKSINSITYDNPIFIKCHQCYTPDEFIDAFGKKKWPKRFTIYTGNLADVFQQTIIVVSAYSSAIVEAASYGIPVIYSMRQTSLNNNMLSGLNIEYLDEVFTDSELTESITKYLNVSDDKRQEFKSTGMKIRDMFFTPINDETMTAFIAPLMK